MPMAPPSSPSGPTPSPVSAPWSRRLAGACAGLGALIALLVLVGWKSGVNLLGTFLPGAEMTRPITAFVLLLAAGALACFAYARTLLGGLAAQVGLGVALLSAWNLVERILDLRRGLGLLAFRLIGEEVPPGADRWMAPNGSIAFVFLGLAFCTLASANPRRAMRAHLLALPSLGISGLALVGYAYGAQALFIVGEHTAMALPTAVGVFLLSVGTMAVRPSQGVVALLADRGLGGFALRRLLPAALLGPLLLGWLGLQGEYAQLLGREMGTALFAFANMAVFSVLLISVVRRLIRLERELSRQREINRVVLQTAPAALFLLDPAARVTVANPEAEAMLGLGASVIRGRTLPQLLPEADASPGGSAGGRLLAAVCEGRSLRDHELVFRHRSGREVHVLAATAPLRLEDGAAGAVLLTVDITPRREAQEALRHSEQRFATVSRLSTDAIWDWDLPSNRLWWNESARKLFGHDPADQPPGIESWAEHIHPEDRDRVLGSIRAAIEGREDDWQAEYRYLCAGGREVVVHDRGHVIRGENGRPLRMLGGMTDITARRKAEEALHFAVRRFETLANLIPQFVWSTRPDGYHDFFNDRWYEYTGMPRGDDGGWRWMDYLHPDDREPSLRRWRASLASGEPYEVQYRFRRASDGVYRWFIGRAVPIRDLQGIARWFGTSTDIEDQRRQGEKLEAQVAERTARLQETVAELEHFSYTLTHDMRAPLRAMQGFSEILLEEHAAQLDEAGRAYLRRIGAAAFRMDHLIVDALNYSKIVRTEFALGPVETGPLLRGLVESYPEFQSPRAEVKIVEPLPVVSGNISGLTQACSNLLGNAVKFVAPGETPRVRVSAGPGEEEGRVRLYFDDNGIGVPEMHRERIFAMFQRLDTRYEGTGVGLALVRKVVERMRGRVGVATGPEGRGSRFWIELARA